MKHYIRGFVAAAAGVVLALTFVPVAFAGSHGASSGFPGKGNHYGWTIGAGNPHAATGNFYEPFSNENFDGSYVGVWLADEQNPTNAPIEITNQPLDGTGGTSAILDSWTFNATTGVSENVTPSMLVYGQGGHLYKVDLRAPAGAVQFSNGSYDQLCSLLALDGEPFNPLKSYVTATVIVGGSGDCASGAGTQHWLIRADAGAHTAPTVEPADWGVLGAFAGLLDGSFHGYIVAEGKALHRMDIGFNDKGTILTGVDGLTNPNTFVMGQHGDNVYLKVTNDSGNTTTDTYYHLTPTGGSSVASYSYADKAPCATSSYPYSSVVDGTTGNMYFSEPTASGYAIYSVPLTGGDPSLVYKNDSDCGQLNGEEASAGHLVVTEILTDRIIGVSESGPATQSPVVMAQGDNNIIVYLKYIIDGHAFVHFAVNPSYSPISTKAIDGDGKILATYPETWSADDLWGGFRISDDPVVVRSRVFLFQNDPSAQCRGTLISVDPQTLTSTSVSGAPTDACTALAYGWGPFAIGYWWNTSGISAVAIDGASGQLYQLTSPQGAGYYVPLNYLPTYPFY